MRKNEEETNWMKKAQEWKKQHKDRYTYTHKKKKEKTATTKNFRTF